MSKTESMVERVARAIYEGRNGDGCKAWGSQPKAHRLPYLCDARAAMAATRAAQRERVVAWLNEPENYGIRVERVPEGALPWITAALAAALSEEGE